MSLLNTQDSPQTPSSYDTTSSLDLSEKSPSFWHASSLPTPQNFRSRARGSPVPTKLFEELKRGRSIPPETRDSGRKERVDRDKLKELPDSTIFERNWENQQLLGKRSHWYEDAFASREPYNCPRQRVRRESVIVAEIKISCAKDASLGSDLSFHLAQSYQRPDSCIMVAIEESAVIMFSGNNRPAYLLTITALSSEIAPTKNKRITALTQSFLQETLEIPSNRGIVRFVGIAEEDLATSGKTTLGEIEALTRPSGGKCTFARAKCGRSRKRFKPIFLNSGKASRAETIVPLPETKEESDEIILNPRTSTGHTFKKRKSIMAYFGK